MYNTRKITDTLTWVGAIDRKVSRFENIYKLNSGMNYNSYFLDCGATVLIDTVEKDFGDLFIENIDHCLSGRTLDYVIIHHMEPDHSATLALVLDKYSEAKIIVNAKTLQFISQFFPGVLTILAAMFFLFVAILFGSSTKRQEGINRRDAVNARLDVIAQTDLTIYWIGEVPQELEHLMPVINVIPPEQASEETLPIKVFQYHVTEYDPYGNYVSEE